MKILLKLVLRAKNVRFVIRRSSTTVRIGCASGFWGDTQTSSHQLVEYGDIDYLVSDYLSEITMSLLTSSKKKNPKLGYAPDFVHFAVGPLLQTIKAKNIKVITNAGGINPEACAEELIRFSKSLNVDIKVAVVKGDDMVPKLDILKNKNIVDMNNNIKFPKTIMSMNAYFGAYPIKQALNEDVDVIITGRCVDSALVLGPLLHEFNWSLEDYDKLACGSLAGHLLECGAQSTGGIFTDWQEVLNWENIGFPIAECYENGTFFITKPKNTERDSRTFEWNAFRPVAKKKLFVLLMFRTSRIVK